MIIFHTDLDNTLIYSYKRDIGADKTCVEYYEGRQVSFMTNRSRKLLQKVAGQVMIVPTTTRTTEQYNRIDLGLGVPEYALTCNGGVLLAKGVRDKAWYEKSLSLIKNSRDILLQGIEILQRDCHRTMEVRFIDELFVFTKSDCPGDTVLNLKKTLNLAQVEVFYNGAKVYIVPRVLSKGRALERFQNKIYAEKVIAAGDSEFDVSMLLAANEAYLPEDLAEKFPKLRKKTLVKKGRLFSEELLEGILNGFPPAVRDTSDHLCLNRQ